MKSGRTQQPEESPSGMLAGVTDSVSASLGSAAAGTASATAYPSVTNETAHGATHERLERAGKPSPAGEAGTVHSISSAGKTVSAILGEITWLMSQSPRHRTFMIGDLEARVMPAILLRQFRLYYEKAPVLKQSDGSSPIMPPAEVPVGCIIYARVNDETAARLGAGAPTLRPMDWNSGSRVRIVEHIAPFGGINAMIQEFESAKL